MWDSRLPLKDRSKTTRDQLWLEIHAEFGDNPEFSVEFLQKKWRSLRDIFVRVKGEYTPSGSAAKKKKKWEYFDLLLFLNDTISYRPTVSNIISPPILSPSSSVSCASTASSLLAPKNPDVESKERAKKVHIEEAILKALNEVNHRAVPIFQPPVPEDDINPICMRISEMLKFMPQNARTQLEIKLLQVAYEGSQKYLN